MSEGVSALSAHVVGTQAFFFLAGGVPNQKALHSVRPHNPRTYADTAAALGKNCSTPWA